MSSERFAEATNPAKRSMRSMVRRLAIVATSRVLWQLTGVRTLDGDTEAVTVEVFPGIGFYARPPSTSKPEAVVVNVGGANAPAIVATRDEQTRKAVADLAVDEAAMFNSQAIVHVKADGTIHARSAGGAALPLATKADVDSLRTWLIAHTHAGVTTGVGVSAVAALTPPVVTGTTVLRGE